jgi:hypothetical protein
MSDDRLARRPDGATQLHDRIRAYLNARGFSDFEMGSTVRPDGVLIDIEIPQDGAHLELMAGGPTADSAVSELVRVLATIEPAPREQ